MTRGGGQLYREWSRPWVACIRLKASEALMGYRKGCRRSGCSKEKLEKSSGKRVPLWPLGQEVITKEL